MIWNSLPWKWTAHSVVFEIASKYCILDSFVDYDGYPISSNGFLPRVVDIMVIWVKFTHSSQFSSLIPEMSMFTLAISHLTTSNLSWSMDLTFQVPMQYCSLEHWSLLPSPVTTRTVFCFCFGPVSSFFLELFLHWSPVAYWAPTNLGSSSLCPIFLPFHTVHGVLKARILKWFAIPFSSGPCFVRTLHRDPFVLGGPAWYGS